MRVALLLALLLVTACAQQTGLPAGQVTGTVTLGPREVPLPPGTWRVVGSSIVQSRAADSSTAGGSTYVASLVREEGGRLTGVVLAAVAARQGTFWRPTGPCLRQSVLHQSIVSATDANLDCITIASANIVRTADTSPHVEALLAEADRRPNWLLNPMFRVTSLQSRQFNFAGVDYFFPGSVLGVPARPPVNFQAQPTARLISWSEASRPSLRSAMQGTGTQPLPAP